MKKTKRAISFILSLIMLINLTFFASAEEPDFGVIETHIEGIDLDEIQKDYELNTDEDKREYLKAVFRSLNIPDRMVDKLPSERVDVLIESEEFNVSKSSEAPNVLTRGNSDETVEGSLRKYILWSRQLFNSSKPSQGYKYSLMVWFEWLSSPLWRLDDTISVDLGAGSIINDSQGATISYMYDGEEHYDSFDKESHEYKGVGTACVFLINLPNEYTASNIELFAYYDVRSSSDELTASGQYFHKKASCDTSISAGDSLGISVTPKILHREYNIHIGIDPA